LKVLPRFLVLPAVVYVIVFWLLTYPLLGSFSTEFFTNAGDGLQNVWNLWWVDRAVSVLHTSPWFTSYLYYPSGVSLVGHTLNPFNGFMAIALLRFLSLVEAHNVIVVFSFVLSGVTGFWLAYQFCRRYWPSIVGGAIFTFSEYHFAHADGHLQLISLEWIPLFALAWYALLRKPSLAISIGSAAVLLLVMLCDIYYFAYSILFAGIVVIREAWRQRDALFLVRRRYAVPFLLFVFLTGLTSGQLLLRLLALNAADPLLGSHDADSFSTDLLAAIIPGGHWRFADLTKPFWDALPGNIQESSVDVGFGVAAALIYLVIRRSTDLAREAADWWVVLGVFWVLSLGPVLRIWGKRVAQVPMPYTLLQAMVPPIDLSGVPARMMVMVTLAAAVLTPVSLALLFADGRRARVAGAGLVLLMLLEDVPRPIPTTPPEVPAYVLALHAAGADGGVLDLVSGYFPERPFGSVSGTGAGLYYQSVHQLPMAGGYVARVPSSAWAMFLRQKELSDQHAYAALCREYNLRYLVAPHQDASAENLSAAHLIYTDQTADADVFELLC
jgi:hypothetical protein